MQYAYAKSIIVIALIAVFVEPIYILTFYYMQISVLVYINIIEMINITFVIYLMKITNTIFVPREVIVAALTFHLAYTSYIFGGITSPATFWLILPILICIITGGLLSCFFGL